MRFQIHHFMCPLCGKETIPVARRAHRNRSKGHRKWLYCPWCKQQVNTYECRSESEKAEFQRVFATGKITETYLQDLERMDAKYQHS